MTSFRNAMMFKRHDFVATIDNAGAAAKRPASPDEEISKRGWTLPTVLGDAIEVKP